MLLRGLIQLQPVLQGLLFILLMKLVFMLTPPKSLARSLFGGLAGAGVTLFAHSMVLMCGQESLGCFGILGFAEAVPVLVANSLPFWGDWMNMLFKSSLVQYLITALVFNFLFGAFVAWVFRKNHQATTAWPRMHKNRSS
jgi:membrane-bound ClpP family serine protease